jgi:hypothetical protein
MTAVIWFFTGSISVATGSTYICNSTASFAQSHRTGSKEGKKSNNGSFKIPPPTVTATYMYRFSVGLRYACYCEPTA